jgi:hypothetical protein
MMEDPLFHAERRRVREFGARVAQEVAIIGVLLTKGRCDAVTMGFSCCHYPAHATRTRNSPGDSCRRRYAQSLGKAPGADTMTKEQKIAISMSAGPPEMAKRARIIDEDESGKQDKGAAQRHEWFHVHT